MIRMSYLILAAYWIICGTHSNRSVADQADPLVQTAKAGEFPIDPEGDADRDGIRNAFDRCPGRDDKQDRDADGVPDGCDLCPRGRDTDEDEDAVPDGCDNCATCQNEFEPRPEDDPLYDRRCRCHEYPPPSCCWQPDEDGDGVGDACSECPYEDMRMSDVTHGGAVIESYEYDDRGLLTRMVKPDDGSAIMLETRYQYDAANRMTAYTEIPQDGSAQPRTTRVFDDMKGRFIGKIPGDSTFEYRNDHDAIFMVTTPADPPHTATILEYSAYEPGATGRLLAEYRRLPHYDGLALVESHEYRDTKNGYEVLHRRRIDKEFEELQIEGQSRETGTRVDKIRDWTKEFPNPVRVGAQPPEEGFLTTHYLESTWDEDRSDIVQEYHETTDPSGVRRIFTWKLEGDPDQPGSIKAFEHYVTDRSDPRPEDKKEWHRSYHRYFTNGGYMEIRHIEPSGEAVLFERDAENPDRILAETRAAANAGRGSTLRTHYQYDSKGRPVLEATFEADSWSCKRYGYDSRGRCVYEQHEDLDRTVTITRQYDFQSRVIYEATDDGERRYESEYFYNAFDEMILSREMDELVRAVFYDNEGRVAQSVLAQYSGDLADFDPDDQQNKLSRTVHTYHPVSGRTTSTVIEHIDLATGLPIDNIIGTIYQIYDETGQWLLESRRGAEPEDPATVYEYDDQGRVMVVTTPEGLAHWSLYDGRGLLSEEIIESDAAGSRITVYYYNSDGQMQLIEHRDGRLVVYEYDSIGRLVAEKEYPDSAATNPSHVLQYEYNDKGERIRIEDHRDGQP